jgi:hypothetical protein
VAVVAATTSYCGSVATAVPRGSSPAAAALPTARGALDERRFVGTDAFDPSAFARARAGTICVTLRTRKHKDEHRPLKSKGAQG